MCMKPARCHSRMCRPACVGSLAFSGSPEHCDEVEAGLLAKMLSPNLMPSPRHGLVRLLQKDTRAEVIEVRAG